MTPEEEVVTTCEGVEVAVHLGVALKRGFAALQVYDAEGIGATAYLDRYRVYKLVGALENVLQTLQADDATLELLAPDQALHGDESLGAVNHTAQESEAMIPEERKAIAMRQQPQWRDNNWRFDCASKYPACCSYHEGFDDTLGLLVETATWHPSRSGGTLHWLGERCEVDHEHLRKLYTIEGTP